MCVRIEKNASKLEVQSPYHPNLPGRARKLGGKWHSASKTWVFDARDEDRVRILYKEIYGTDGTESDLVTIWAMAEKDDNDYDLCFYVAGRQIARAYGRDSGAKLGEKVILLEGSFGSSGSMKYPTITVKAGTVVEIRDVPRGAVKEQEGPFKVQIIEGTTKIDREALEAEKEKLEQRLKEVNALLQEV